MKRTTVLFLTLVAWCSFGILCSTAWGWQTIIEGTNSEADQEHARAVAIDSAGDVVVGGVIFNTGADGDFAVVKLSGEKGEELWRYELDGTASSNGLFGDFAWGVSLDNVGYCQIGQPVENVCTIDTDCDTELGAGDGSCAVNVVSAGTTNNGGTNNDFTVVKLSGADGGELWRRVISGTGNSGGADLAKAVVTDVGGHCQVGQPMTTACSVHTDCDTIPSVTEDGVCAFDVVAGGGYRISV